MPDPRPTADLAALALIYHQRVSGAHNNDDRDVPCQWCVLRAEQHVEVEALRAASRPAVEWRIAKCPHCGEELSVAASRSAVGEEGLRAALVSDEYTRGWNEAMEHAARIADSLAASAALAAADKPEPGP